MNKVFFVFQILVIEYIRNKIQNQFYIQICINPYPVQIDNMYTILAPPRSPGGHRDRQQAEGGHEGARGGGHHAEAPERERSRTGVQCQASPDAGREPGAGVRQRLDSVGQLECCIQNAAFALFQMIKEYMTNNLEHNSDFPKNTSYRYHPSKKTESESKSRKVPEKCKGSSDLYVESLMWKNSLEEYFTLKKSNIYKKIKFNDKALTINCPHDTHVKPSIMVVIQYISFFQDMIRVSPYPQYVSPPLAAYHNGRIQDGKNLSPPNTQKMINSVKPLIYPENLKKTPIGILQETENYYYYDGKFILHSDAMSRNKKSENRYALAPRYADSELLDMASSSRTNALSGDDGGLLGVNSKNIYIYC